MKKIMLFAAACAALAACSKDIDTTKPENTTAFEKGQKVTLTVNAGEQTKVSSELVTSGTDKDKVNFKWETGDKIKVTVGTESAEFTLSSGAGDATAEFTGTMPAAGDNFDVQYPVEDPVLTTQTYSATESIPHDKMKFTATDCSVGTPFTLTAENAALRLNLYGYTNIGSIVVTTNEGTPKTYTFDCKGTGSTGTEPSKTDKPKPFFIVVPAGTYGFSVSVKNVSGTELYTTTTTSNKTFVANGILNMKPLGYPWTDAQPIAITTGDPATTIVWAPVNCGYEPKTGDSGDALGYPYGKLYQWGRKYGQGYKDSSFEDADYPGKTGGNQFLVNSSSPRASHPDGSTYNGNFYHDSSWTISNWYGGSDPDKLWNSNEGTSNPVSKSAYDPCPEGWRVPTMSELDRLAGGDGSGSAYLGNSGWDSTNKGYWFNGTSSPASGTGLFLPAAGSRKCNDGSANYRGRYGDYWSSSVHVSNAWYLFFSDGYADVLDFRRASGYSVRCVQE